MTIRSSELRKQLLRVGPEMLVGAVLRDLASRRHPQAWLLLCPIASGYAILSADDLAARVAGRDDPLNQRLSTLDLVASTALDIEADPADAQALLAATGYVLVLRDEQPYGVLVAPWFAVLPTRVLHEQQSQTPKGLDERVLTTASLLAQAADWQPPARPAVLGGDEAATPPVAPIEALPARTDRYVNTDFAAADAPGSALNKQVALQPGQLYFFRLNIGELELETTIEATPLTLPPVLLDRDIELVVVVWSERFAIEQRVGVLRVPRDGPATVAQPAALPDGMDRAEQLLQERLLFRVQAPAEAGIADLRVSLYCNGMLVQSRLVTAVIGAGQPLNEAGAMRVSTLDFNLSPLLEPRHLSTIAPHTLSLMVNSMSDGTHAFRLLGQQGQELFTNSATLAAGDLSDLITQSRAALQKAAWGSAEPWNEALPYRYDPSVPADQRRKNFEADLINMAVRGALTYNALKNNLGQGSIGAAKLRDLMRAPGLVQLASKISANDVVPIAMFYDWKLDTRAETLTLCEQFAASLASGRPLIGESCFLGACPHHDDDNPTVVCPSGFWGFRHDIGMPWPAPYGPDVATQISSPATPLMDIALNREFPGLPAHLQRLGGLGYQLQSQEARDQIVQMFKHSQPQVIYFYCHGVDGGSTPMLKVGPPDGYIDTSNFANLGIAWPEARPLIFLNGCHTTQLSPAQALSFVRTFVEDVAAAGVIGTEITIFEALAQPFAETFLPLFAAGVPFGRAIRSARLQLLASRNPLGLVYQPYAYAGLTLVKA